MAFDYKTFLQANGVTFNETGKNVKRDNIALHCPFCGAGDPGQHMGINLKTGVWGCWRNRDHSGFRPEKLIAALLNISWRAAKEKVGDGFEPSPDSLYSLAHNLKRLDSPPRFRETLRLPREVRRIGRGDSLVRAYRRYLWERRGFRREDVQAVIEQYDLCCALTGDWQQRLIIPSYRESELVGWMGRAIVDSELRYKAHPTGADGIKRAVYNHNAMLRGGEVLVIVEGGLDAIKTDFYAQVEEVRAVGILSTSVTPTQAADLIRYGRRNFERVLILLDAKATAQALSLASYLAQLRPIVGLLPPKIKDPGSFAPDRVLPIIRGALRGRGIISV